MGIDRELRHRDAGLRTHMLVGLGSAAFTIAGLEIGQDASRVAAQVVSGIGFLGAGTIFRAGNSVRGLTTAAGLWTVAAVGMAAGFGLYALAIVTTLVGVLVLHFLRPLTTKLDRRSEQGEAEAGEDDD
jgi:putative Mg2+ transporter-C (MgtC) family protein